MRYKFLGRILAGAIVLNAVFSGADATVVYAADNTNVSESVVLENFENDSAVDPYKEAVTEGITTEVGASEEISLENNAIEGETVQFDEATTGESQEKTGDVVPSEAQVSGEEDSSEASTETKETSEEETASETPAVAEDDASAEDSASTEADVVDENKSDEEQPAAVVADLGNPDFGEITDIKLPESVSDIGDIFTLGFSFFIKDAEVIADGIFTYTMPKELDFSVVVGRDIPVFQDGTQIGTAIVSEDNVITFKIDPAVLKAKPNGIHGTVGLNCRLSDKAGSGDTPVKVEFSNSTSVEVSLDNPIITATKAPVVLKNGIAQFSVKFHVSADAEGFTITDKLGDNLVFFGSKAFNGAEYSPKAEYVLTDDDHTLTVNVGHIPAGDYVLRYSVRALENFSTSGMTVEEIIAAGNGNTASWSWDGALEEHNVMSYATTQSSKLLRKVGTNGSSNGKITPDGIAQWKVYINGGTVADDVSGYTFVDVLDERMSFDVSNIMIRVSDDQKTWRDYKKLDVSNLVYEDGCWKIKYTFDEETPVAFYSISYKSQINELPLQSVSYTNKAYLYYDGIELASASAKNFYGFSGKYDADITKMVETERDDNGIVEWKSVFHVLGERKNYSVSLRDVVSPDSANQKINGKTVGTKMLDSVEIYRLSDAGQKIGDALTGVQVIVSGNELDVTIDKLEPGTYAMFYKTQDYYDEKNNHTFPGGSEITINNRITLAIDESVYTADSYYVISSSGLPMRKYASRGSFDNETGSYIIPWVILVNKNEYEQIGDYIADGTHTVITDILPKNLEYIPDSTVIRRPNSSKIYGINPSVEKREDGTTVLKWEFDWENRGASQCFYKISFNTKVNDEYFKSLVNGSGKGTVYFSFSNNAYGDAGSRNGIANYTAVNKLVFLDKTAAVDEKSEFIKYSIVVNDKAVDLVDGDELKLTDSLDNGTIVTGSLHVYDYVTGEEISIDKSKISTSNKGKAFALFVPDSRALRVEYSVKPDLTKGVEVGNGKVSVPVKNEATLYGEGVRSDKVNDKYTVDEISASISSERGEIRITKVDSDNAFKGLEGAVFGLYRVNTKTGKATLVESKITTNLDYSVTFSNDGQYESLIFDTLYYYQEIAAPKGYKLDDTKHYVVFKGSKYEKVRDAIETYLAGTFYEVVDVKEMGASIEVTLGNHALPETPDEPGTEDPKPNPGPGNDPTPSNPSSNEPSATPSNDEVVTITATTEIIDGNAVVLLDIPTVLGASRNPDDLPEVLGARRSSTGDRDMTGAYVTIIVALFMLGILLTKRNKENKIVTMTSQMTMNSNNEIE